MSTRFRWAIYGLAGSLMLGGATLARAQAELPTQLPQTRFLTGQDVVPVYEGWLRNTDGSFTMVFGYFNRNWKEELAIPADSDNVVEPAGPDRGQPTYFLPRRQSWVYRVRVPKDWGEKVLTWTITSHGRTEKAYGELLPVQEIAERMIMTRGNLNPGDDDPNRPPSITIVPVSQASVTSPVTLTAMVTDDGLPKPRLAPPRPAKGQINSTASERPRGLGVTWYQYRGPAKVTFEPEGRIAVNDGQAVTTARFTEPGTYVLRAMANDGALSTTTEVTVTVASGSSTENKP